MSSGKIEGPEFTSLLTILARELAKAASGATISASISPFGPPSIKIGFRDGSQSVDARIAKIDAAKQNLTEAIEAIDELAQEAELNRQNLEALAGSVERAERERSDVHAQLDVLKDLAKLDSDAMRRALKLPTAVDIWRDRVVAFFSGIGASVAAALIWEWLIWPTLFGG